MTDTDTEPAAWLASLDPEAQKTAAAWWATLDPEVRKFWFFHITGWSLEGTISAAFDKAQGEPGEPKSADIAFQSLVKSVDVWRENYMDQWEKFKFDTEYGHIFVTISVQDHWPDSFDLVDRKAGRVIQQAGILQPAVPQKDEPEKEASDG